MKIAEQNIAAIQAFGYTESEARFLYIVATHSGYFIPRQFIAFTGAKWGKRSTHFAEKIESRGHAAWRKYPGIGGVIPWAAFAWLWHLTWEFIFESQFVKLRTEHAYRRLGRMVWIYAFVVGGLVSIAYLYSLRLGIRKLAESHQEPLAIAKLDFTFFPLGPHLQLIKETSVSLDNGAVTVMFTAKSVGTTQANNGQLWMQICGGCRFAEEPQGADAAPGNLLVRRKRFDSISPGVYFDPTILKIIPPSAVDSFTIAFKYGCERCPPVDNEHPQKLRVWIKTPTQGRPATGSGGGQSQSQKPTNQK